jgi:hypothetical protein
LLHKRGIITEILDVDSWSMFSSCILMQAYALIFLWFTVPFLSVFCTDSYIHAYDDA